MPLITRRSLLSAAAAATAVTALPALSRPALADTTLTRIIDSDTYPIGMWWPPPPDFTTPERYVEIADAGFTFVTAGDGVAEMPLNGTVLACADASGLLAIPQDSRVYGFSSATAAERAAVLAEYAGHRSFAGWYLFDEPNAQSFPPIGDLVSAIHQTAPQLLPYINLFPNYATPDQLGAPTYDTYLAEFVDTVHPPFLSYDFYPFMSDGTTFPGYFANWASVRAASLRAGIPSWIFIQSIDYPSRRRPTEPELRWQVNISLAYGCKGIQYFCYWSPGSPFGPGLISRDGQRTELYDAARRINNGYLRPVGKELMPLVSESVTHANDSPLPAGATAFTPDRYVAGASGSALVLGRFRAPGNDGSTRWLLVANRSSDAAASARLTFGADVGAVLELDLGPARYVPVPGAERDGLAVDLDAGSARLFRLELDD